MKNTKIFRLFLVSFVVVLILFVPWVDIFISTKKTKIEKEIQAIPVQDLLILEDFFRKLLFFQEFAYTLFGDKPVSMDCFDLENKEKPDVFHTPCNGYFIWKKYAPLFNQHQYVFLFYEDEDEHLCELTLINKMAFRDIVDKHKQKFTDVFGPSINAEMLLNMLIDKRSFRCTPMKDQEDLIGILLGYGKLNAELFQQRNEILRRKKGIKKRRTEPSFGYASLEEELKALNASLKSFSNEKRISLNYMKLPGFAADGSFSETAELKKKYTKQRKHITKLFSRGDILKIALEQLCSESSCDPAQ